MLGQGLRSIQAYRSTMPALRMQRRVTSASTCLVSLKHVTACYLTGRDLSSASRCFGCAPRGNFPSAFGLWPFHDLVTQHGSCVSHAVACHDRKRLRFFTRGASAVWTFAPHHLPHCCWPSTNILTTDSTIFSFSLSCNHIFGKFARRRASPSPGLPTTCDLSPK